MGEPELDSPYFNSVAGQKMAAQSKGGMEVRPCREEGDSTLQTLRHHSFAYSTFLVHLPAFQGGKLKTTYPRLSYSWSWDVI